MTDKKQQSEMLIHSPARASTNYVNWAESIQNQPGVSWGIEDIDRVVIPMRPGNLVFFTARPGHGKTSIMAWLAKREAERLRIEHNYKEVVVYVTWEQAIEELEAFFQSSGKYSVTQMARGEVSMDIIRGASTERASLPIWLIGHSVMQSKGRAPRLFPEIVADALLKMREKYDVTPRLVLFDYIQLIPIANMNERVSQVTEAPVRLKEIATNMGFTAVCGAQARQEVDDSRDKIPGQNSAQWASSIHQTADKHFAFMRPALYFPLGDFIEIEGYAPMEVTENLIIVRLLKQRFAQGRKTWALYFNPEFLKLEQMALKARDFNAEGWGE